MTSPTTLMPAITPEAAVPPNLASSPLAFSAMSSNDVPAAPR